MIEKIRAKYYRWLAKKRLVNRYGGYLQEVNNILEEYLTAKILQGGSQEFLNKGRNELAEKQAEIKENASFVDFLKRIK
ncbi:hypothetical protein GW915_00655 [bacterium]|nr:hypothetical protein [bacterium]